MSTSLFIYLFFNFNILVCKQLRYNIFLLENSFSSTNKQISVTMSDAFEALYSEPQCNCVYLRVEVWLILGAQRPTDGAGVLLRDARHPRHQWLMNTCDPPETETGFWMFAVADFSWTAAEL